MGLAEELGELGQFVASVAVLSRVTPSANKPPPGRLAARPDDDVSRSRACRVIADGPTRMRQDS